MVILWSFRRNKFLHLIRSYVIRFWHLTSTWDWESSTEHMVMFLGSVSSVGV